MNEYLKRAEIYERFESEWVLLGNPKTNKQLEVLGGIVLHHGKDRDDVYRAATRMKPKRFAVLYTGKIPKGTAVIL